VIREFKDIGEYELINCNENDRKIEFLKSLTIVPNEIFDEKLREKLKDKQYEIVFNFDTINNKIKIELGKEYSKNNRYEFFGFESPSNFSKIYFTTNNWDYHLKTIPQMIKYIYKNSTLNSKYENFKKFLINISNEFYKEIKINEKGEKKSEFYIDYNKLIDFQKEKFMEYYNNKKKEEKNRDKSEFAFIKSSYKDLIIKDIFQINENEYKSLNPNVFSLKIDGQYIQNMEEFKNDYIDIVYYSIKERFFNKKLNVSCDICGSSNNRVTDDIQIPTKFYITDKPYFFENLSGKNAYKSFSMCEKCYEEVRVGISEIEEKFSSKLFGNINYYLIPKNIKEIDDFALITRKIIERISYKKNKVEEDYQEIERIKKLENKTKNLLFDFLFWFIPKGQGAAFVVIDNINDISYDRIKYMFDTLDNINNNLFYQYLNFKPNINDLYYFLFPNKYSHGEVDNKLYRKEIVKLYSSILKERKINYYYLISNFNFIFRKTFFNKEIKNDRDFLLFRPIKMNILISWLNKITKLEGGLNIMEGNSIVEITDNDVKEFFEIHKEIYSDNYFRQGLFLLGKLVNSILNEQKEKSSNFMDKINLEGIPVHRVRDLVFQVTDYLKIYKLFELENKTYSQMMDRLQGIENSNLSKDDVLFCILSGISFGRYLGTKYAALKDKNKDDINIKGEKNE